jgi:deoxyribodipyrimidine photo-lyase
MYIVWFRQDLRLTDNHALTEAVKLGEILPIYILDDDNADEFKMGAASRVWLHHALNDLDRQLAGQLRVFEGDATEILPALCQQYHVEGVYWNRCYEPWRIQRDKKIKQTLVELNIPAHSFAGLLWEPWTVLKKDQTPYRVFTPFFQKGCLASPAPKRPIPKPSSIDYANVQVSDLTIDELHLLPHKQWDKGMMSHWQVTEQAAAQRLQHFITTELSDYKDGRNFPAKAAVSRLSPYLHFGQISPQQIWYALEPLEENTQAFALKRELVWREFAHSLLYYLPHLPQKNLQAKFDCFPWQTDYDPKVLKAWQQGQTGYPIVDAGMRELWQTGYMHNRVRMIVASFLVKNLLIDWRVGQAWFWDCLVDADLANNSAGWQWVADCGVDAAPYFRIFNPVLQGEKFDKQGVYTRRYVPELANIADKYLFNPWQAPADVLAQAGIELGKDYPLPIIDLAESRQRALDAYQQL